MKFNAKISPKLYKCSVNIFGNCTLKKNPFNFYGQGLKLQNSFLNTWTVPPFHSIGPHVHWGLFPSQKIQITEKTAAWMTVCRSSRNREWHLMSQGHAWLCLVPQESNNEEWIVETLQGTRKCIAPSTRDFYSFPHWSWGRGWNATVSTSENLATLFRIGAENLSPTQKRK